MKKTMDGNEAAAYISYAFTEVAAIYPITPASPMAEYVDEWASQGKKNIFGETVRLLEMQSEAGAISAMHGAMEMGVLTSTYTASQGLLLMIPTMYRIAGQLKPGVIHVASRSVGMHAYSIQAEHSDVMACRQTGFAILASSSVQEVMDLAAVAHLSTIKSSIPFLHFFDGFRTSHEIQKIECLDYNDLAKLVDRNALEDFRKKALNPEHPIVRTTGQTPETYFQSREACQEYYERVPAIVEEYMLKLNELTGKNYKPFNYHGAKDAENIIIAMGSVSGACRETVEYLNERGKKTGYLEVHLYRPFSVEHFIREIPKTAKIITVLDRTKENGALADPLYADICAAVNERSLKVKVVAGRYGLGGKDVPPAQILAVFENAETEMPVNHFTVGIQDDVFRRSLTVNNSFSLDNPETVSCKFWGLGSDGTVGANKNSIKIIGDNTDLYIQAYFEYDGKKSGGLTRSHLRFGKKPIHSSYYVTKADFVACHQQFYLKKYDLFKEVKPGGAFLLNCSWSKEELEEKLPASFKRYIAENQICFYVVDATGIAGELGLGSRINLILQAAFFKIIHVIPIHIAVEQMKAFAKKTYGIKGEDVVEKNCRAIEKGIEELYQVHVPKSWMEEKAEQSMKADEGLSQYVREILLPVSAQKGNEIPISSFRNLADGSMPVGTSKYERRGIAVEVPCWEPTDCIQCNKCASVCPNAAIRPFLLKKENSKDLPANLKKIEARGKGLQHYTFTIQIDPADCIGCGSCVSSCPQKDKALVMAPLKSQMKEMENWDYLIKQPECNPLGFGNIKNSQFSKPLLEFPGCCPGCGETPYVKLITQLYGERMCIATATGCSLVWATDYPIAPYTVNDKGYGPAISNSLFENNGEFGFGMALGTNVLRGYMKKHAEELIQKTESQELKKAAQIWLEAFEDGSTTVSASEMLKAALATAGQEKKCQEHIDFLFNNREYLTKKSIWILGGDGWAYDIGYGGLDHVLASGEDVNILVLDTEVYSNTGGQASKATQRGAVAQFAASGRKTPKKELGLMAMSYGNVYVASVALGANPEQYLKAVKEAETFKGPSMIIAYVPCQLHGLKCGMSNVMEEMKRAVETGYWMLYRYDPRRKVRGQSPLVVDSKEPKGDFQMFLSGEVRFDSLKKAFPEEAERLFGKAEREVKERYWKYKKMEESWG